MEIVPPDFPPYEGHFAQPYCCRNANEIHKTWQKRCKQDICKEIQQALLVEMGIFIYFTVLFSFEITSVADCKTPKRAKYRAKLKI